MKRYLRFLFPLVLTVGLVVIAVTYVNSNNIDAVFYEVERYERVVTTDQLALIFTFIFGSFFAGWLYSKLKQY